MDGLTIRNYDQMIQSGKLPKETQVSSLLELPKSSSSEAVKSFSEVLKESIETVDQLQKKSDHLNQELAAGKTSNIEEVLMAAEKADIALRLMVQVRNKVIDAYQEIMKMQL